MATGVVVAVKLTELHDAEAGLLGPLTAALGLLTGLGVWQIAYGGGRRSLEPKFRLRLQG
ncbi:hypothetical protein BH10PSE3_BH10PSE3_08260 [soil metagenome]